MILYANRSEELVKDQKFKNYGSKSLEINSIIEGSVHRGEMHGYCRIMRPNEEGTCTIGFFSNGVALGKGCEYNLDGSNSRPEGLYD